MKKFLAVVAAALTLATAGAASAQGFGRTRDNDEWRGRGGQGGEIVVRDLRGRMHSFDRRDYQWSTLVRSPFAFRPGLTYVYTDDCRRGECQVYIYERGNRRPLGHLWAPTLNDPRYFRGGRDYYGRRDDDRRWGDHDRDRDRDRDWD